MPGLIKALSKDMPEGLFFCKWVGGRFRRNKNLLLTMIGPTGSGKSYASVRLCELWYKYYFNKDYPAEHIVFDLDELSTLLTSGKLKKGDIIIFEEAGVALSSLEWQNKLAKITGYIFQTFRSENIGIIFTLPSIGFLNKTTRVLLHAIFETAGIDMTTEKIKIKPLLMQYNSRFDKSYNHYPRVRIGNRYIAVERLVLSKPSEAILIPYEQRKQQYVKKVMNDLKNAVDDRKPKTTEEILEKTDWLKEVVELSKKGMHQKDIVKALNNEISQPRVAQLYALGKKLGILPRKGLLINVSPILPNALN